MKNMNTSENVNNITMNIKYKLFLCGISAILFLVGCGGGGTFENIKLIGSAKDAEQSTIGNNPRMVYMSSGSIDEVCDAQANLITEANWKATEEPRKESTYKTSSYSDGKSNLVLMCSEQEGNAGIKVTLTLQKGK